MNHPELDELLDLVRDDAGAEEVRRHADGCAQCTADLEAVARLDAAADLIGPTLEPDGLVAPASSLWDRVQAELAQEPPVVLAQATVPRRSRRRLSAVAAAAAIAGILAGGVGGYMWADKEPSSSDRTTVETRVPIAVGTLTPAGQSVVSGEVAMNRIDSSRSLTVTFSEPVPGPGYVEAWLFDPLTNEMIGLGILGPEGGTVTVPLDADLSRFTSVDISREPFDGDPAHSSESLAQGILRQI